MGDVEGFFARSSERDRIACMSAELLDVVDRSGPAAAAPRQQSGGVIVLEVHRPQNWHQTGTSVTQKTKKSAGANLLTFVFLGSPTWARTRDLRINSPALYRLSYRGMQPMSIARNFGPAAARA